MCQSSTPEMLHKNIHNQSAPHVQWTPAVRGHNVAIYSVNIEFWNLSLEANTYPSRDRPSSRLLGQIGFCSTRTVNSDVCKPILVSGLSRPVSFLFYPGIRDRFGIDAWGFCGPPQRWLQFHCRVDIQQAAKLKVHWKWFMFIPRL